MNRRELIVALACGLALQAGAARAQADVLEAAFAALPMQRRRSAQVELQLAGLYAGAVDGAYGPGTRAALIAAAQKIAADGRRGRPDLATEQGARDYLARLSNGEFMNQLYDDGYEGEVEG
jgi:peptidoglycan hydrolase-like protein with peptidoglycan-binding domain